MDRFGIGPTPMYIGDLSPAVFMANALDMAMAGFFATLGIVTVLTVSNLMVNWVSGGKTTVTAEADKLVGRMM